ncbi:hypothetical protein U27_00260 [Candidatus Vecturithrix granuli]|uniref:Uncharacterized protein n=1 Tax=Vecturithrix granuli TaxID=1499967 RepID=A0A081C714_VECG1|nr:hypothetical protein U27_00260 [Candidatus Vecturithrix granuli]
MLVVLPSGSLLKQERRAYTHYEHFIYMGKRMQIWSMKGLCRFGSMQNAN